MKTLYKKSCLKLSNYNKKEILFLIKLSDFLKQEKKKKKEKKYLKNKKIVLIFDKESTRTRCSFEISAFEQGAHSTYIGPNDTHFGYKESVEDSAIILGQIYDGIQYRGNSDNILKILKENSKVPIWNGLTKNFHPTQILADLLTFQELNPHLPIEKHCVAYIGDAKNNICNTLIEAAVIIGFQLNIISPKKYWPNTEIFDIKIKKNIKNEKNIKFFDNPKYGVKNSHYIYTDVWLSMNENPKNWKTKIKELYPYQINKKLIQYTNNENVKIMHCLPALHDQHSIIGKKIHLENNLKLGIEISHEMFISKYNKSFLQAKNRLHTIKAILVSSLSNKIFF